MAEGLLAYSAVNNITDYKSRNVAITIKKAENGFIFELEGTKEIPERKGPFPQYENFTATFVYQDLQEGLREVDGFFQEIDAVLEKKGEKAGEITKKGRGRPKKA